MGGNNSNSILQEKTALLNSNNLINQNISSLNSNILKYNGLYPIITNKSNPLLTEKKSLNSYINYNFQKNSNLITTTNNNNNNIDCY